MIEEDETSQNARRTIVCASLIHYSCCCSDLTSSFAKLYRFISTMWKNLMHTFVNKKYMKECPVIIPYDNHFPIEEQLVEFEQDYAGTQTVKLIEAYNGELLRHTLNGCHANINSISWSKDIQEQEVSGLS